AAACARRPGCRRAARGWRKRRSRSGSERQLDAQCRSGLPLLMADQRKLLTRLRIGPLTMCLTLAACTGQPPPPPPGPVDAVAQVSAIKLLSVEWTGAEGAESFQVSRLVDGQPTVVADDIPGPETAYHLEVFLPEQLGARYVLDACNAGGCTSSPEIEVKREALDAGIGYVKAPVPGGSDLFGNAGALSADGTVLAVGVPLEDGSGSGVGPPVDEGLTGSGA